MDDEKYNAAGAIGTEARPVCYLCGRHGEILYRDLEYRIFGTLGQCLGSDCSLVWLDPMPTRDEIGKAYQNYYTHDQPQSSLQTLPGRIARLIFHLPRIGLMRIRNERKRYKCMYLD